MASDSTSTLLLAKFTVIVLLYGGTVIRANSWPMSMSNQLQVAAAGGDSDKLSNSAEFISSGTGGGGLMGGGGQNSIGPTGIQHGIGGAGELAHSFGNSATQQQQPATFGIAAEDRMIIDTYVTALVNHTYVDGQGRVVKMSGDNSAKFGEGQVFAAAGKLELVTSALDVTDNTACSKNLRGRDGRELPAIGEPWIALVRRGKCNFEDKVKHAYAHHAIAVIVYNDKDSLNLDKMKINNKEREFLGRVEWVK